MFYFVQVSVIIKMILFLIYFIYMIYFFIVNLRFYLLFNAAVPLRPSLMTHFCLLPFTASITELWSGWTEQGVLPFRVCLASTSN